MTDTPDLTTPEGMREACEQIARNEAQRHDYQTVQGELAKDASNFIAQRIAALSLPSPQEGPPRVAELRELADDQLVDLINTTHNAAHDLAGPSQHKDADEAKRNLRATLDELCALASSSSPGVPPNDKLRDAWKVVAHAVHDNADFVAAQSAETADLIRESLKLVRDAAVAALPPSPPGSPKNDDSARLDWTEGRSAELQCNYTPGREAWTVTEYDTRRGEQVEIGMGATQREAIDDAMRRAARVSPPTEAPK